MVYNAYRVLLSKARENGFFTVTKSKIPPVSAPGPRPGTTKGLCAPRVKTARARADGRGRAGARGGKFAII